MNRPPVNVRSYQSDDLDALYRVCLLTADNGGDGTALFSDPQLPGHVYAAPYAIFEPALAFVAEDAQGVGGYIVAAGDSQAFHQRLEREWWPGLRERFPEPSAEAAADMSPQQRFAIGNIHRLSAAPDEIAERYPAHLHINLVPRLQGLGAGRRLVSALVSRLRERASPGLHLLVRESNRKAIGFYRHVGFTELPFEESVLFAMQFGDLDPA